MKALAALCLFALAAGPRSTPPPTPTPDSFALRRPLTLLPARTLDARSAYACAVLDADVFAHAAAGLGDLRLYLRSSQPDPAPATEAAFAITLSRTATEADPAGILNAGLTAPGHLGLDLAMPARAYSSVDLGIDAKDFIATARVNGLRSLDDRNPTYLGVFSLFDLTSQRLGRNTSLALSEATFPWLHLDLAVSPAPGIRAKPLASDFVASALVPPSRVAQTLYTPIAETSNVVNRPRQTVATFHIPAHVPIERVTFVLDPAETANFSRPVTITATLTSRDASSRSSRANRTAFAVEQLSGDIARIRLNEAGQQVHQQTLSVPAILGSNSKAPAAVEVVIENGDDRPLRLAAVRLEMRQRKLCFGLPPAGYHPELDYGGPGVEPPVYDFSRVFNAAAPARTATLGPEASNPGYRPLVIDRPFNERYPELLWIALVSTLSLLAVMAWRSAKTL